MLRKLRIIETSYISSCPYYVCQIWRLWYPLWVTMKGENKHYTLKSALDFVENYKKYGNGSVKWADSNQPLKEIPLELPLGSWKE